ncbi:MAG: metal ABC transporter permease [Oscillochloris sp.]|nr:metal ABC transporter permease [Oscillochloris sp.]
MMELLIDLFTDYTLRSIALGAAALGIVSGILGCFAVMRRQALLGDAMSHAALPGVILAFMLTGSRAPLILVLGAALAGWLGALAVLTIVRMSRIKEDSAFGLVLSVFFAVGMVLLTILQRSGQGGQEVEAPQQRDRVDRTNCDVDVVVPLQRDQSWRGEV